LNRVETPETDADADKVRVPVKLLRLLTVMVELPELPAWIVGDVGLADIPTLGGSPTTTVTTAVCLVEPAVPVTVMM